MKTIARKRGYHLPENLSERLIADIQQCLSGSEHVKVRYLSEHMLSKFASPARDQADVRRKAAIAKWLSTEERNERTNDRLYNLPLRGREVWFHNGQSLQDLLLCARRLVKSIIGNRVPYHLLKGSFSGGASTSKRRQPGMVGRKFSGVQDVTSEAWSYMLPVILDSIWRDAQGALTPRFCNRSHLFTVPKSDTIDRVACKEPDYNMYLQKGAGDFIRHRLRKRAQIDLNDQTVNQRLAWEGSLSGSLSTIDLSSASDSMSQSLVWQLLPEEWFDYLNAIRVKHTQIADGERADQHVLRMFSSMGNGFTFELESLLFWALCLATVQVSLRGYPPYQRLHPNFRFREVRVAVYGDDIIVPTWSFGMVKRTLNYFGFNVNVAKTFHKGPIRESCGKHYHNGNDITPFYIRGPVKTVPELINVLNSMRRWSTLSNTLDGMQTSTHGVYADHILWPVWKRYSAYVDKRFWGGYDLSDRSRLVSLAEGKGFRLMPKRKVRGGSPEGDYLHWLHDAEKRLTAVSEPTVHSVETTDYVARRVSSFDRLWEFPVFAEELTQLYGPF